MAKDRERQLAEPLYIKERKTAKEISKLLNVNEKTIGSWVDKYHWKDRRNALLGSIKTAEETANKLGNVYAEKLLILSQEDPGDDLEEKERISKEEMRLGDLIAKLNKYTQSFTKEHRIPYNVYINVAEEILAAMLDEMDKKVHPDILDFFENHTNTIALKYK